jgi:hypothetical protein
LSLQIEAFWHSVATFAGLITAATPQFTARLDRASTEQLVCVLFEILGMRTLDAQIQARPRGLAHG